MDHMNTVRNSSITAYIHPSIMIIQYNSLGKHFIKFDGRRLYNMLYNEFESTIWTRLMHEKIR